MQKFQLGNLMTTSTDYLECLPMPLCEAHIDQEIGFAEWKILATDASSIQSPEELTGKSWETTQVPGTVAQHLFKHQRQPGDFEALDWWYSTEFDLVEDQDLSQLRLLFEGLATLTEIWLNGILVQKSESMFLPLCVTKGFLVGSNRLHLCFRSLNQALAVKRPRPAWKTPLVEQQQLRWFRTSIIGRAYGWTQPWPILGPWRGVRCFVKSSVYLRESHLFCDLRDKKGFVEGNFLIETSERPQAILQVGDYQLGVNFNKNASGDWFGKISCVLDSVPLWWPHTHGEPVCLATDLIVKTSEKEFRFSLGKLGFRSVTVDRTNGKLAFVINGVEIFSRGATWTTDDVVSLSTSKENLRKHLLQARDAGLNMLRLNGTMVYETDDFFDLCDELGILVWQDFMFACMDYPTQDSEFGALVDAEAIYHIKRQSSHACMAAYCGSNEIQMQAMMVGLPATGYENDFFDKRLPEFCKTFHPGIPYFVSSPCEGELPFQPQIGTSHYYGVGAFRQPLADAELSQVKFATECLAFSNVPEAKNIDLMLQGKQPYTHSPEWKIGVPRMSSTGYDFEDVRDFYLKEIFDIDALTLRAYDTPRYLDFSRVAMLEITERTLALWRSDYTPCKGALLFFWRDLYLGAGWGAVDSIGQPKSVFYAWKRACQPRAIFLIPRGMNGLMIELINETAQAQNWRIEIKGYNHQDVETINVSRSISIAERDSLKLTADSLIGHFTDLPHAFRFGPIQHRLIHARLFDQNANELIGEDFFFPKQEFLSPKGREAIDIHIEQPIAGVYEITLKSAAFLQWAKLDIPNFELSNNYFHLAPNAETKVTARTLGAVSTPFKGYLEAINLGESIRLKI